MTPYYQDNHCTIYNCDCEEILPDLPKVDLVLTDPPYGMNYVSNHRFEKYDKIKNDDKLPVATIKTLIAISEKAAYFFCRWDNLKDMPPPKSVLVWVKNNWSMGDLKHEHGRQWEACCFYPGEHHEFIKRIPDVIEEARTGNNLHPTEKPIGLLKKIINCNLCDTVLDPYMGSGTTIRAAKDLNRKAIGIEIEEKYCEIAAERMCQEVLEL
jgi:site-specific DNA-methyltransferase (adenine-specific)